MTGFEYNEDLKECCILFGASCAVTVFKADGVPIMPEPFYETVIVIPPDIAKTTIVIIIKTIEHYLEMLEVNKIFCTEIVVDIKKKNSTVITYTIFEKQKRFTKSKLKYINSF